MRGGGKCCACSACSRRRTRRARRRRRCALHASHSRPSSLLRMRRSQQQWQCGFYTALWTSITLSKRLRMVGDVCLPLGFYNNKVMYVMYGRGSLGGGAQMHAHQIIAVGASAMLSDWSGRDRRPRRQKRGSRGCFKGAFKLESGEEGRVRSRLLLLVSPRARAVPSTTAARKQREGGEGRGWACAPAAAAAAVSPAAAGARGAAWVPRRGRARARG